MAVERFEGLTDAQLAVFEQIALNQDAGHNPRTLQVLRDRGLIEAEEVNMGGHPPMTVTRYHVPIHVHMRWCAWAGENVVPD